MTIDEATGAADGFAVDVVRLLVNRRRENTCKGTVSGVVLEKDTDQPIAKARVFLADKTGTQTDAAGQFTLKGVPTGLEVSYVSPMGFWLLLDAREVFVPFKEFPWFRDATIGQLSAVERAHADHLYWPELDVDLAIESLDDPERFPLISQSGPSQRHRPAPAEVLAKLGEGERASCTKPTTRSPSATSR